MNVSVVDVCLRGSLARLDQCSRKLSCYCKQKLHNTAAKRLSPCDKIIGLLPFMKAKLYFILYYISVNTQIRRVKFNYINKRFIAYRASVNLCISHQSFHHTYIIYITIIIAVNSPI